jgi:hypothetical protein
MTLDKASVLSIAQGLASRRIAPPPPLAELRQQVRSRDFWRALAPQLSVEAAQPRSLETGTVSAETIAAAVAGARTRGYFQVDGVFRPEVMAALRGAVEALAAAHWPPVFTYVFDEFWQLARTPTVRALLRAHLGEDCVQWPGVWTHRVHAERGSHGWAPHVDSTGYSTEPEGLGVWFPLSDATLDNGCMYVIARDFAPPGLADQFSTLESVSRAELRQLLQSARALPAPAGAVLGWDFNVIHWGSVCQGHGEPRLSTAMEFASARQAASKKLACFSLDAIPTFEARLRLIGQSLLSYLRFEPQLAPYEPLAREL